MLGVHLPVKLLLQGSVRISHPLSNGHHHPPKLLFVGNSFEPPVFGRQRWRHLLTAVTPMRDRSPSFLRQWGPAIRLQGQPLQKSLPAVHELFRRNGSTLGRGGQHLLLQPKSIRKKRNSSTPPKVQALGGGGGGGERTSHTAGRQPGV